MTRLAFVIVLILFCTGFAYLMRPKLSIEPNTSTVHLPQSQPVPSQVVRATRDIARGEQFDRDAVEEVFVKDLGVTELKSKLGQFPYTSALVLGNRAARDLSAGHLLTNDDVKLTDEDMR